MIATLDSKGIWKLRTYHNVHVCDMHILPYFISFLTFDYGCARSTPITTGNF